MRDERQLLRWLDLSWFAPLPLSLGLAIWAVMTRPEPGILATLLLVQMALLAGACSAPASQAARDSRIWRDRVAPRTFTRQVHRAWREHAVVLLALGLVGPVVVAARSVDMGAVGLACWALALPIWGAALGTLAAWAWSGSLPAAALALGPVLAGSALAMGATRSAWLDATGPAAASLGAGLLMLAWVWRATHRLQPRWPGVAPLLARWRHRRGAGMPRWRWATLAFDDQRGSETGGAQRLWAQYVPFLLLGFSGAGPLTALMARDIAGSTLLHLALYAGYLLTYAMTGLVVRVTHWRLQLAPRGLQPNAQVARMLVDSTLFLWATTLGVIGFHAWRQDLPVATLALPACRAGLDAALCVGLAAWLRGLSNRSVMTMLALLGITAALGGVLWLLHAQDLVLRRDAGFLAGQAAFAVLLMGLATRAWRHRIPRGMGQWPGQRADAG